MGTDYIFPGSVLLLKFGFKVCVDQDFKWIEFARSFFIFPADLAFLAFSFGAITIGNAQAELSHQPDMKAVLATAIICILLLFAVTIISRATNRAFDESKYKKVAVLSTFGYSVAIFILISSLNVGAII